MTIHELIRPEKRHWKKIRAKRDYESIRQGYNQLKLSVQLDAYPYYAWIGSKLLSWVALNAKILDAGCGDGSFCRELKKLGFADVTAFDISDVNVLAASRYAGRAFRSNCEQIPEPDSTYDFVVNTCVIECTMDARQSLREFFRVLRPGGYLFIETNNAWWHTLVAFKNHFLPKSRRYVRFYQPIDGDFTRSEMRSLLRSVGFIEKEFVGRGGLPCCDRVFSKILRRPTTDVPLLKNFTSKLIFLLQKPGAIEDHR